ncbi:MAG TPA: hypothetical protein VJ799_10590 [Nitrososphaeraceae archaeon]|nr:hypothetical protein [Nitrososphaeraceae archaeon]
MELVFSFRLLLVLSLLLLLITTISYAPMLIPNVLADSPSFSRQEVGDDERDGININGLAGMQTADDYKDPLDNSTDILKITYLSDAKNLNASLWLGGNFTKDPAAKGAEAVVYGMLVDVDSNPRTGFQGVDYQLEVQWMNSSKIWNMFLGEYPSVDNASLRDPAEYLKILDIKQNYTDFFVDNKPYITLSLPLDDVAFPSKFKAMYYGIVIYDSSNMVVDLGSWIDIPPADLTISTLPNPVVIRQGEQKNIAVQLKSNDGVISNVASFLPIENYSKIDMQSNNVDEPEGAAGGGSSGGEPQSSSNMGPTTFITRVASDAEIGEYTIPILVNISTGSVFPSEFLRLSNFTFSVPTKGNILTVANLSMTVTEPVTTQEQIKEFWGAYGGIITLVGAGFGGGLASYVLDRVKSRKNNNKNSDNRERTGGSVNRT